uniref:Uncharacterized protein n=1 Tax=Rhizophora mucronata TaxID=61149 RepID=A0A2P2QII0_RHIMU
MQSNLISAYIRTIKKYI